MLRIQRCVTHEQALNNRVYISPDYKQIPQDTQYVVINRRWVFVLARSSDCPLDAILTNCNIRNLMNTTGVRLDSLVTVEPLGNVQPTPIQYNGNQPSYLAMFKTDNPEVGPLPVFRKLAVNVLRSLGPIRITDINESSIEFSDMEHDIDRVLQKYHANYNNVKYYIKNLVKVSDISYYNETYLDDLDGNQVMPLAKLQVAIPQNDKVAGTFADMDYGECVCHVIQPNVSKLYEYIKTKMANTVIYAGMTLAVDTRECFGLDTNVAMMFKVTHHLCDVQMGVLTPDTVIEFVS